MQQINRTALIHPTMIAKIRSGMFYAQKGQGHMMNGHGKRVYIQNAKGRNIMRLDWIGGRAGYIVYGNESVDVTKTVRNALASVVVRELLTEKPSPALSQDSYKVDHKNRYSASVKMAAISTLGILLSGCASVAQWL